MRKQSFFALFLPLFFLTTTINAQQAAKNSENSSVKVFIKGTLLDSLTKKTEPYVTMRIVQKGDAMGKALKMAVSDNNGNFKIEMPTSKGDYVLVISSIGKETIKRDFQVGATSLKSLDLGKIYLKEEATALKGVEVIAKKPLVKMEVDKLSYDIESDPDSKTNSVIEMLRKVPLVTVDGDDNIKVNGSSNFKIYVNGKPNTMMSNNPKEVLKSMPASAIKKIEVITSPGAKYDAEGTAGILNIVTTQGGMEGYSVNLNGRVNNRSEGTNIYAIAQKGKLTMSMNYGLNHYNKPESTNENHRENYDSSTQKFFDSYGKSTGHDNFRFGTLEASYEVDSLQLLSTSFTMYGSSSRNYNNSMDKMWNSTRDQLAYQYGSAGKGSNSWNYIEGSVDYQRTSRKNKERIFTLSYKLNTQPTKNDSYLRYDSIIDNTGADIIKSFFLNNTYSNDKNTTAEHTFQADYSTPISKYHKLDMGVKYILRNNSSNDKIYQADGDHDTYVLQNDRSSHYKHLNDIFAAYLSYTFKYKSLSLMPGLRYELTNQRVKYLSGAIPSDANFNTHYGDLVPSVTASFKLGETKNLRFEYNMRIMRPSIENLNPYFDNRTPMSISQGNSDLKSEKSHTFNLNYGSFSPKFNLNINFSHSFNNNGIESISRLIGENGEWFDDNKHYAPIGAMYTTYENIGHSRNTGLSGYLNWNPTSKFQIYMNYSGYYSHITSPAQGLKNYGWTADLWSGVQYTMPCKIRFGVNFGGSTPKYMLQGKSSGYRFYSFRLNRSFMKEDRLTISAFASNIFEKNYNYNSTTSASNFVNRTSFRAPQNYYGIGISYRIGSLKAAVKKTEHSISNDDVKGGKSASSGSETN